MPRAELATLGSYGRALRFAHALATTALLAGCFADEGFGLDSTPDTDGDDETAATAPCEQDRGCVPLTPEGWSGPLARWQGAPGQAPACPASLPIEWARFGDLPKAPPVACACTCDSEVDCGAPHLSMYPFSDCQGMASIDIEVAPGDCRALGSVSGSGARASAAPPELPDPGSPGGCTATTHELERATPTWRELTLLCGATDTDGDCGALGQCMPHAELPMLGGSCVFRPGEHACPSGPWTVREVVHESFSDARACTECSCGEPDPSSCAATIELFTDDECGVPHPAVSVDATCEAMQGYAPRSARVVEGDDGTLACAPSGGDAIGDVTAVDAITLCCTP